MSNNQAQLIAQRLIEHATAIRLQVLRQVKTANFNEEEAVELAAALERLQHLFLRAPLELLEQASRNGESEDAAIWVSRIFQLAAPLKSAPLDKYTIRG